MSLCCLTHSRNTRTTHKSWWPCTAYAILTVDRFHSWHILKVYFSWHVCWTSNLGSVRPSCILSCWVVPPLPSSLLIYFLFSMGINIKARDAYHPWSFLEIHDILHFQSPPPHLAIDFQSGSFQSLPAHCCQSYISLPPRCLSLHMTWWWACSWQLCSRAFWEFPFTLSLR